MTLALEPGTTAASIESLPPDSRTRRMIMECEERCATNPCNLTHTAQQPGIAFTV